MAGFVGRANTLTWGGVTLAGIREKGLKVNGEPIDETTGENNGWRSLLTTAAQFSVDLDLSGIVKSKTLPTDFFAGNTQKTVVYTRSDGSVFSGTFMLATYNETSPYKDATSFDASLQSSGTITFTP
jgi:predicted secreted protein